MIRDGVNVCRNELWNGQIINRNFCSWLPRILLIETMLKLYKKKQLSYNLKLYLLAMTNKAFTVAGNPSNLPRDSFVCNKYLVSVRFAYNPIFIVRVNYNHT